MLEKSSQINNPSKSTHKLTSKDVHYGELMYCLSFCKPCHVWVYLPKVQLLLKDTGHDWRKIMSLSSVNMGNSIKVEK